MVLAEGCFECGSVHGLHDHGNVVCSGGAVDGFLVDDCNPTSLLVGLGVQSCSLWAKLRRCLAQMQD